jgi:hypothetical protein
VLLISSMHSCMMVYVVCSSLPSNQNGHSFMFFSGKGCSRPAGLPLQKRSVGEFWRIIVSNSLREAKS